MNKRQTRVLWAGIITVAIMGLFPPWLETFHAQQLSRVTNPRGYAPLFYPPRPGEPEGNYLQGINLDTSRLVIQWVVVAIITGGLLITFSSTRKPKSAE